jgi:ketosteroid isomerase-like protein
MAKLSDAEFERIVRESNQKYDDFMNHKRDQDFADLVTKDYIWVDDFKDIVDWGKDVTKLAKSWMDAGVTNEKITLERSWNYGNVGFHICKIEFDSPDATGKLQRTHGRFCEVLELEADGKWRTRAQFYFPKK